MIYNKAKYALTGIILGGILTVSIGNIYANTNAINAWIDTNIRFKFNDEFKELPENYTVILYEGRSYVHARFVAENLGGTVTWNESAKVIDIKSKESGEDGMVVELQEEIKNLKKEIEKLEEEIKKKETDSSINYQKLPIRQAYKGFNISATVVDQDNTKTAVYLNIDNKGEGPVQLKQIDTKAVVDGKEYYSKDMPAYRYDMVWYNDVHKDENQEGYVIVPSIPEDSKNMSLFLKAIINDYSQETIEIRFDISLDK